MTEHTHPKTTEMFVYWIPADPATPMELKLIPNKLDAFQNFVGGYIERVHTNKMPPLPCGCSLIMVVNEEGLLRQLPFNERASYSYYPYGQGIAGDAFLIGEGLIEPNKKSASYDPEDGPEPDFFSLPTNFHSWAGPGHDYPTGVQAWER